MPAPSVYVQHATHTHAGVLLLPEGTCLLPVGTGSKQKVQTFCFFHYGSFHYNWKERMRTYMERKLGTAYTEKKGQFMRRIRTQSIQMNSKPNKFS